MTPKTSTNALGRCAWLVTLLAVTMSSGCHLLHDIDEPTGKSPLRPPRPSLESVTLEVYWARFAFGDPALNEEAWQEIDEGKLPVAVRRELADNGFRAGVVGGTLPQALAVALQSGEVEEQPSSGVEDDQPDQTVDLMTEPTVRRRLLQLKRGRRAEIQASEIYPSLPLLVRRDGELTGDVYPDAQAVYALRVDPQPDGRVELELTPELQYGPSRIRWTAEDGGVWRQEPMRDAEVYTALRTKVSLAPGEMLVLMSLPQARCKLGDYFHTVEAASGRRQKLILIRLAEVPDSDTFAFGQ